jgi:DNA-binding PadR family transcriptional regulator
MAKKNTSLELVVLGLLFQGPMHGYELKKRVSLTLGPLSAISYGSLYPELRRLQSLGFIDEDSNESEIGLTRRARISYKITKEGKDKFNSLLKEAGPESWDDEKEAGPESWDDENFLTYFAFFAKTASAVRLQILQGRRTRLQERMSLLESQIEKTEKQMDQYTLKLQNRNLNSVENELKWIDEMITSERKQA